MHNISFFLFHLSSILPLFPLVQPYPNHFPLSLSLITSPHLLPLFHPMTSFHLLLPLIISPSLFPLFVPLSVHLICFTICAPSLFSYMFTLSATPFSPIYSTYWFPYLCTLSVPLSVHLICAPVCSPYLFPSLLPYMYVPLSVHLICSTVCSPYLFPYLFTISIPLSVQYIAIYPLTPYHF